MGILNKLLSIFKDRAFLLNLLAMILIFISLIFGVRAYLDHYTLHGETISVPDLQGGDFDAAEEELEKRGLNAILKDSVHIEDAEPGSIVKQNPAPEKKVKDGRNVYITIQSTKKERVDMPDLTGRSKRQAISMLRSIGLEIEEFRFEPDLCVGCVIGQRHEGESIEAGTRIAKGSGIELVLGAGKGDEKTRPPNLIGKTIEEAESRLLDATLNIGALKYDEDCCESEADSLEAKIFKQSPSPLGDRVQTGSSVTLWFTTDTERVDSAETEADTIPDPEEPEQLEP